MNLWHKFDTLNVHSIKIFLADYYQGFCTQCLSVDRGLSTTFDLHLTFLPKNIWLLENVGDLSDIPPGGAGNIFSNHLY